MIASVGAGKVSACAATRTERVIAAFEYRSPEAAAATSAAPGASIGDEAFNGILTGSGTDSLGMGGFGAAGANTGFGADNGGGFGPGGPTQSAKT